MTNSWHTHQTLEECQIRWVEEKHRDEKSLEHELCGVLEIVIQCFVERLVLDYVEVAIQMSRSKDEYNI